MWRKRGYIMPKTSIQNCGSLERRIANLSVIWLLLFRYRWGHISPGGYISSGALTRTLQICRFFSPSFGGRMASAFSLVKSISLYLVIGPMWQKFILLTIAHYSKIDWPIPLFGPRSSPFMSSDVIFLQAKWSKIKERVEGWKSGKKMWFKRITVWLL